jgi:hypothetical protein
MLGQRVTAPVRQFAELDDRIFDRDSGCGEAMFALVLLRPLAAPYRHSTAFMATSP